MMDPFTKKHPPGETGGSQLKTEYDKILMQVP
jgi:hypothetical protein